MSDFVREIGKLLAERWNTPAFQFRLTYFVQTKRDRELLSHFQGWSQSRADGTVEEWCAILLNEPKYKNKTSDSVESALKDALVQAGCEYPDMDKYSLAELQVANHKFALVMEAAGKVSVAPAISAPARASSPTPPVLSHIALSIVFKKKLRELEEEHDSLSQLANSGGDLTEKLGNKQTDLKVAKQECAKLESQVKSALNEIRRDLTTDIEDVEKAHKKMGEYKKLIGQRDDASSMVEGLDREISALKRTMEEQKKEARKDVVARQQVISQNIDILLKAADILGVSLGAQPTEAKPEAKPKKVSRTSRREGNNEVLLNLSNSAGQVSVSSQFTLLEDQRRRINQLNDGVWYGTKFGHAGVMRTASQDPDFRTNADFLQAMIDGTYRQKADQLPGSSTYGLLRDISAVRNRIASFPIWNGEWAKGGTVIPDAIETFIQSREQNRNQSKAS